MFTVKAAAWIRAEIISAALLGAAGLLAGCGMAPVSKAPPEGAVAAQPARMPLCSSLPHCVSSLDPDIDHHTEPLHYSGSRDAAQARLIKLLAQNEPRMKIITNEPGYVHIEIISAVMRFTDDFEMRLDAAASGDGGLVQLRSSSRIGYYDFGVNRDRVEELRAAFEEQKPAS